MAELVIPFAKPQVVEALSASGPSLRESRLAALKRFDTTPVESSPLFKNHVITDGAPFGQVEVAPNVSETVAGKPVHDAALAGHARIADGVVHFGITKTAEKAGVKIISIIEALKRGPQWIDLVTAEATNQRDKFFQLTRALFQDGLIIDVPAGVKLAEPITIDIEQRAAKRATFSRVIVRLGEGASAEILETQNSMVQSPSVQGVSTEAHVAAGAHLRYSAVGNFGPQVGAFINRQAAVGTHGKMQWSLGNFGGALTKSLTHTSLDGNDSEVKHTEVVFGAQAQKFDISSFVTHIGHRAKSDVLARAALRHKSRGNVKGMITIDHRGHNADSYLGQFALLLDPEAKSVAIPGLEINTAQVVRAKHAAAVHQVDENQVFYLQSRGVPAETARRLIVEGFLHAVITGISSQELRDEVHRLIQSKWG